MRMTTHFGERDVRVVAFDLNGTLTDADGRISAAARSSLRRLQELGVKTVLMTGCTREELVGRGEAIPEFDAIVLESGTIILDGLTKVVAPQTTAIVALRERCETSHVPCRVGQASLTIPARFGRQFYAWPESSQVTTHVSRDRIDVTPPGYDKGTGLQRVLSGLGHQASDCVAFGDSASDVPMFAVAGYSVAVANAEPGVMEAADEVAAGHGGDAVAAFIDRRFQGGP